LLALTLVAASVVAASTTFSDVAEQYIIRGQPKELFSSLSGRTVGWMAAWELFQESPIFGHGFVAAARAQILGTGGASTLHGSIFEVLVGVGLLGLIPWALAVLWTCLRVVGLTFRGDKRGLSRDSGGDAEMLGLLALILVRSLTSSDLAMHDHAFMLFLSVLAYASAALHPVRPTAAVVAPAGGVPKPNRFRPAVARRPV
jgi:O-antigen ligase